VPGAPAPKKGRGLAIALAVIAVIVVIGLVAALAGGGDDDEPTATRDDDTEETGGSTPDEDEPDDDVDQGFGSQDASDDVGEPTCERDELDTTTGSVTVTNTSSETSDYWITIVLESADGTEQLDTTYASVDRLEPDQSTEAGIDFFDPYVEGSVCRVTEVSRTASGDSQGFGSQDAMDDAGEPTCGIDDFGDTEGSVTVTNTSSEASDYLLTVVVESADGSQQLDSTTGSVTRLEPDQRAEADLIFFEEYQEGSVCRVTEVSRTASDDLGDEAEDVGEPECRADDSLDSTGGSVSVSNSSSERSDYSVTIALESADGSEQIDTTFVSFTGIEPGQSANEELYFFEPYPAGATCRVIEVYRSAS
jgi:hypothetical protein